MQEWVLYKTALPLDIPYPCVFISTFTLHMQNLSFYTESSKITRKKGNNENKAQSIFSVKEFTAFGVPIHQSNFGLLHLDIQLYPVTDVSSSYISLPSWSYYSASSTSVIKPPSLRRGVVSCNATLEIEGVLTLHNNVLKVLLHFMPGGCLHQQLGEVPCRN